MLSDVLHIGIDHLMHIRTTHYNKLIYCIYGNVNYILLLLYMLTEKQSLSVIFFTMFTGNDYDLVV